MIIFLIFFMMSFNSRTRMKRNYTEDDLILKKKIKNIEDFSSDSLSYINRDNYTQPSVEQPNAKLGKFDFLSEHESSEFLKNLDQNSLLEYTSEDLDNYFQELPNFYNTDLINDIESNLNTDKANLLPDVLCVTENNNANLVNDRENNLFTDNKNLFCEDENVETSAKIDKHSVETFEVNKNDEISVSKTETHYVNDEHVVNVESSSHHQKKIQTKHFDTQNVDLSVSNIFVEVPLLSQIDVLMASNFIVLKEFTLHSYIEHYITKNIHESYASNHLRNVNSIKKFYDIIKKCELDCVDYKIFFDRSCFQDIIQELLNITSSFEENIKFNKKTCQKFLLEFDKKISKNYMPKEFCWDLEILSDDQKHLFFYFELMKLYKYFDVIPEILTLGGLNPRKLFHKIIMIMHIINLFAENVDDVKNYRKFILFLISKAFICYYGGTFDIFRILNYKFRCSNGLHDLTFFLWELNCSKRQHIKRRKGPISRKYDSSDKVYFKVILLIYLYQHTIFFKFNEVDAGFIKSFEEFIVQVVISKDCVGCLFNEYLLKIKF